MGHKKKKIQFAWHDNTPDDLDGLSGRDAVVAMGILSLITIPASIYSFYLYDCVGYGFGIMLFLVTVLGWASLFRKQ